MAGKLPVVYVMFTVILLSVGLDVSQYRESGVSFSSKKTLIPLNLQMMLTKLWIKSDPQCHLADVPGGDVRQPLAVYDSHLSDQRDSLRSDPMFSHPDYDGHEALLFAQDTASRLRALVAIH